MTRYSNPANSRPENSNRSFDYSKLDLSDLTEGLTPQPGRPVFPTHPGVFLREEFDERGWGDTDLWARFGGHMECLTAVLAGDGQITPKLAEVLSAVLGTSAEIWLDLQERFLAGPVDSTVYTTAGGLRIEIQTASEYERRRLIDAWETLAGL